jgi:hypothetical protein
MATAAHQAPIAVDNIEVSNVRDLPKQFHQEIEC